MFDQWKPNFFAVPVSGNKWTYTLISVAAVFWNEIPQVHNIPKRNIIIHNNDILHIFVLTHFFAMFPATSKKNNHGMMASRNGNISHVTGPLCG